MTSHDVREVRVPVATMWTSPQAPRDSDAAAVADAPDAAAWAGSVVTRELVGRTLSQLLLGEPARVLEEADGWARVEALWQPGTAGSGHPGYVGWVRAAHLGSPVARATGASACVVTPACSGTRDDGSPMLLSFGTTLPVDAVASASVEVLLPDDSRAVLPLADVTLAHAQQPTYRPDDLLDLGRQFLGLGYVWGGTSGWGLDCSGLVHLTHRAVGVTLPRDAADMAVWPRVEAVALDEARAGDLYFFAKPDGRVSHVGYACRALDADGARWMLHAPEGGGRVEERPMPPEREASLVAAGRVRTRRPGQAGRSSGDPGCG